VNPDPGPIPPDSPASSGSPAPSTAPAGAAARARRRALFLAGALVAIGTGLFASGAVAKLRDRDHPDPRLLGIAAWQIATAGFACTLAGGLWLRRHVA
jgi:hypothetical protein